MIFLVAVDFRNIPCSDLGEFFALKMFYKWQQKIWFILWKVTQIARNVFARFRLIVGINSSFQDIMKKVAQNANPLIKETLNCSNQSQPPGY